VAWASEVSKGQSGGQLRKFGGLLYSVRTPGPVPGSFCRTRSSRFKPLQDLQNCPKQASFQKVLLPHNFFPAVNHQLTVKPVIFRKYPLLLYRIFLLLHPASEEGF